MGKEEFNQLRNSICIILSKYNSVYADVRRNNDWKNSFRFHISDEVPTLLRRCANITMPYKVEGSYGKGRWTSVPWVAVFDTRITTSARKGVYIVYLFNKDAQELYLTLESAATEALYGQDSSERPFVGITGKFNERATSELNNRVRYIRDVISNGYFNSDQNIDSGSEGYDAGTIYYKRYSLENMPSGEVLVEDLKRMLDIYKKYYEKIFLNDCSGSTNDHDETEASKGIQEEDEEYITELDKVIPVIDIIQKVTKYINAKGFTYPDNLIENFYLSLKSKPFVILAGISGTGKTKLTRLFAEAIGAEYKMIPVRPDWSDSTDLFGHVDLNGRFIPGVALDFIKQASDDPDRPYLLCLDEMNLARVEYYLSDFLSVIETRELKDGHIISDPLVNLNMYGTDEEARDYYGILYFPENLYIVGTVNMDETTFPFSKKVLDRANTIEFNHVNLVPQFADSEDAEPCEVSNDFLRGRFTNLSQCMEEKDFVLNCCTELEQINQILMEANLHVGYRVRDEIIFYLLNNKAADDLLSYEEAMDHEILQKILPRIQGSTIAVRDMLCHLFKICAKDLSNVSGDDESEKMRKVLDNASDLKYRMSAEKIQMMVRRFEEDGFTSYWI